MSDWLRSRCGLDREQTDVLSALADLFDELKLVALDTERSSVIARGRAVHVSLCHRDRGRIVEIDVSSDIVISYGEEHEHFAPDDADVGRIWPFGTGDHVSVATSFLRYLLTGRIELHIWRRPLALKARSYWIADDGNRVLFLRSSTLGPVLGWSRTPTVRTFEFTFVMGAARCLDTGMEASRTHHTIDYIEFRVRNIAEAKAFYGTVFGWTFNDYGSDYAGIKRLDGDGEIGGFCIGEPGNGGPLVVFFSDDLEASHDAIRSAGGTIVREPFAFPGGRRFHFRDPSGNELGVWAADAA